MAAHIIAFPATAPLSRTPALAAGLRAPAATGGLRATVAAMWQARHTRRLLADMDAHLLADIGIGPSDAMTEAARPFWDCGPRR